ncbi:MAG TPA: TetR/AcrR family transcriptional regulator [Kofleriaceae bacterium]
MRASILDAAEEMIAQKGLHGSALVQIAKRAGVAVGTLYNYFADRDALVRALFESRRQAIRPQLLSVVERARALPSFEARLRWFVHETLGVYEAHRSFLKVAIETEHLRLSQPSTGPQDLLTAISEIVAAGAREGVIGRDGQTTADLLAMMLWGGLKAVLLRRVTEGGPFVSDADAIVSVFLEGARGNERGKAA